MKSALTTASGKRIETARSVLRNDIVLAARASAAAFGLLLAAAASASGEMQSLQQYRQAFPEPLDQPGQLTSEQLAARFGAAYETCFYTAEPSAARDLLVAARELQLRQLATREQWADTYQCLLSARLTREAAQVHAERKGERMGSLPRFAPAPAMNPGVPSIWRADAATRTLHREPVDLRGNRLVVVAHPNCGFSRRAVHAMSTDPQLQELARTALWIAPAAGPSAWDRILAWNAEHPEASLSYAWREQDWPMIDDWATPSFYFLPDGKVEARVRGWPEESRSAELLAAAAKLGSASAYPVPLPAAQHPSHTPSTYAGQEQRGIKALSAERIEGLLAGKGMGYAKAAELNRYPGPLHVLELANELELTEEQLGSTRAIHADMQARAKALGSRLVDAEAELEQLFRSGSADKDSLSAVLGRIGRLEAELRGVHLGAHIEQRAVLTDGQVQRYVQLRGYGHAHHGSHGHDH